jgi:hypothetical protein
MTLNLFQVAWASFQCSHSTVSRVTLAYIERLLQRTGFRENVQPIHVTYLHRVYADGQNVTAHSPLPIDWPCQQAVCRSGFRRLSREAQRQLQWSCTSLPIA